MDKCTKRQLHYRLPLPVFQRNAKTGTSRRGREICLFLEASSLANLVTTPTEFWEDVYIVNNAKKNEFCIFYNLSLKSLNRYN